MRQVNGHFLYLPVYSTAMPNLKPVHDHVVAMLKAGLPPSLSYHNISHTLDVMQQCYIIATEEGITNHQTLFELQVAALYHDTGFLYVYYGHEEKGCDIAREQLPGFGFSHASIDRICELIMATKVPQRPNTHLQEIICDADLDYLGRADFFETGNNLHRELMAYNLISGEHDWEERQLQFLQSHQYFTQTSRLKRGPLQLQFIDQLNRQRKNAQ